MHSIDETKVAANDSIDRWQWLPILKFESQSSTTYTIPIGYLENNFPCSTHYTNRLLLWLPFIILVAVSPLTRPTSVTKQLKSSCVDFCTFIRHKEITSCMTLITNIIVWYMYMQVHVALSLQAFLSPCPSSCSYGLQNSLCKN